MTYNLRGNARVENRFTAGILGLPEFDPGAKYLIGDICRVGTLVLECVADHTAAATFTTAEQANWLKVGGSQLRVDKTPAAIPADVAALQVAVPAAGQPVDESWIAVVGSAGAYRQARIIGGAWTLVDSSSNVTDVTPAVIPSTLAALEVAVPAAGETGPGSWTALVGSAGTGYQWATVVGGVWTIPLSQPAAMTGATLTASGLGGEVPIPTAGTNDLVLHGDGFWRQVAPDWVAGQKYSAGAIVFANTSLWRRITGGTSGAAFNLAEQSGWDRMSVAGESERVFLPNLSVNPAIPGQPSLTEVFTAAGTTRNAILYFTGADVATAAPTFVWHIDGSGDVTLLRSPATAGAAATPMTGATAVAAGTAGTVAAPTAGTQDLPFHGDGTYKSVAPDWAAGRSYTSGVLAVNGGTLYRRIATGTSAGTFAADATNWTALAPAGGAAMTGATSVAAGTGGTSPVPAAGSQDLFLAGDATFKGVAPDWVTAAAYSAGALAVNAGVLYRRTTAGTSAATFAADAVNWLALGSVAANRVFLSNTTVAPATPSQPTLAEITARVGTNRSTLAYYTGSDTGTDVPTYLYWVDGSGVVTLLRSPQTATAAMTGATSTVAGTGGTVPVPGAGTHDLVLHSDGTWSGVAPDWIASRAYSTGAVVLASGRLWRRNAAGSSGASFDATEQTSWTALSAATAPMTGATSAAAGTAGSVSAPALGQQDFVLHGDGSWGAIAPDWVAARAYSAGAVVFSAGRLWRRAAAGTSGATFDVTEQAAWTAMSATAANLVGANATTAGTAGQAPAPAIGQQGNVLRGDASWGPVVTSFIGGTTYSAGQLISTTTGLWQRNAAGTAGATFDAAEQANWTLISNRLTDPLRFRGGWDASAGTFPGLGTAQTGDFYRVTVAGTVGAQNFQVGDSLYAETNNASPVTYAANWVRVGGPPVVAMTGASSTAAGVGGTVPAPAIGQQDMVFHADGTWSEVAPDWVTGRPYTAGALTVSGWVLYRRNTAGTSGASFAADSSNWTALGAVPSERVFLSNGAVLPAVVGAPTVAEITTAAGTNRDTLLYFTGTNVATDPVTHVYQIDGSGDVTLLRSPQTATVAMTGATGAAAGTGGTVPGPGAAGQDSVLHGDGTWRGVAPDWVPATAYSAGALAVNANILYRRATAGTSGATFAADAVNWTALGSPPAERVHLTSTATTVATPGNPTLAEALTAAGTNRNTLLYYTNSDVATDPPTYVWHIDGSGDVTLLRGPAVEVNVVEKTTGASPDVNRFNIYPAAATIGAAPAVVEGAEYTTAIMTAGGAYTTVERFIEQGGMWVAAEASATPLAVDFDLGIIGWWPGNSVPSDAYIPASGGTYNDTDYPHLAAKIQAGNLAGFAKGTSTFTVPDLNSSGRFIRGLGGRAAGTLQAQGTAVNGLRLFYTDGGAGAGRLPASSDAVGPGVASTNSGEIVSNDPETRPVNVSYLAVIRAKPHVTTLAAGSTLTINNLIPSPRRLITATINGTAGTINGAATFVGYQDQTAHIRLDIAAGHYITVVTGAQSSGTAVTAGQIAVSSETTGALVVTLADGDMALTVTTAPRAVAVTANGAALTPAVTATINSAVVVKLPVPANEEIDLGTVLPVGTVVSDVVSGAATVTVGTGAVNVTYATKPRSLLTDAAQAGVYTWSDKALSTAGGAANDLVAAAVVGTGHSLNANGSAVILQPGYTWEITAEVTTHRGYSGWVNYQLQVNGADVSNFFSGFDGGNWMGGSNTTHIVTIPPGAAARTVRVHRAGSGGSNGNTSGNLVVRAIAKEGNTALPAAWPVRTITATVNGAAATFQTRPSVTGYDQQTVLCDLDIPAGQSITSIAGSTLNGGAAEIVMGHAGLVSVTPNGGNIALNCTTSPAATYTGLQKVGQFTPLTSFANNVDVNTGLDFRLATHMLIRFKEGTRRSTVWYKLRGVDGENHGSWFYDVWHCNVTVQNRATGVMRFEDVNVSVEIDGIELWADAALGYVVPTGTQVAVARTITATVNGAAVNVDGAGFVTALDAIGKVVQVALPAGRQIDTVTASGGATVSPVNPLTGHVYIVAGAADSVIAVTDKPSSTYQGVMQLGVWNSPEPTGTRANVLTLTTGINLTTADYVEVIYQDDHAGNNLVWNTASLPVSAGIINLGEFQYTSTRTGAYIDWRLDNRTNGTFYFDDQATAVRIRRMTAYAVAAVGYVVPTGTTIAVARTITATVNGAAANIDGVALKTTWEGVGPVQSTITIPAGHLITGVASTLGTAAPVDARGGIVALTLPVGAGGNPVVAVTTAPIPATQQRTWRTVASQGVWSTFGSIQLQMPNAGNRSLQVRSAAGSITVRWIGWLTWDNMTQSSATITAASAQYLNANYHFTNHDRIHFFSIYDETNNRSYEGRMVVGASYNDNIFDVKEIQTSW